MSLLSDDKINEIRDALFSTKSAQRRSAAKKIGKYHISELENELLTAYQKERCDKRTWETQTAMLIAFGKIKCKAALPYLSEIIAEDKDNDTITIYAALSYIRVTRKTENDMTVVLDFLENRGPMVFTGAINALAWDDILPSEAEMKQVLDILERRKGIYDRPYSNPVSRIISAMYRWPNELIMPFINQYKGMPQYASFVENTLAGKRSCRE